MPTHPDALRRCRALVGDTTHAPALACAHGATGRAHRRQRANRLEYDEPAEAHARTIGATMPLLLPHLDWDFYLGHDTVSQVINGVFFAALAVVAIGYVVHRVRSRS